MAELEAKEAEKEAEEERFAAGMKVGRPGWTGGFGTSPVRVHRIVFVAQVGDRCEVKTGDTDYGRRGVIMFLGAARLDGASKGRP